jgi:hypothetical protein
LKTLLSHFYIIQDHQFYPDKFGRNRSTKEHGFSSWKPTTFHNHLTGERIKGSRIDEVTQSRGHDDRVLLIFADTHPIQSMEGHKALQENKAPDSITELGRPRFLSLL